MAKNFYEVHLFRNGEKQEDLTPYLVSPIFLEDKLNEELDTGEIILECCSANFVAGKNALKPKTKVVIDRYQFDPKIPIDDGNGNMVLPTPIMSWDMVVETDNVERITTEPPLYTHRINLIEPSVIAQGMHCDNISLTYELRDVDLNYKTYTEETVVNYATFTARQGTPTATPLDEEWRWFNTYKPLPSII